MTMEELNGTDVGGCALRVNEAQDKPRRSGGGGGRWLQQPLKESEEGPEWGPLLYQLLEGGITPSVSAMSLLPHDLGANSMLCAWKLPLPRSPLIVSVFMAKVKIEAATASLLTSRAVRFTLSNVSHARW